MKKTKISELTDEKKNFKIKDYPEIYNNFIDDLIEEAEKKGKEEAEKINKLNADMV